MKRTGVLFGILGLGLVVGSAAAQETSSKKQGEPLPAVAGVPAATKPEPPTHGAPDTYGTTAIAYYRIAAAEFTPLSTNLDPYGDYWYNQPANIFRRYATVDDAYFVASPHLPSGATITYFELDACSTSSTSAAIGTLYDCDFQGDCSSAAPVVVAVLPSTGCLDPSVSGLSITVNNFNKQQTVRVQLGAHDDTTSFAGVILGYHLNVSPAPADATFPDVPTSDFGFQYIEALSASGITGGCGGGLYCPDAPVTRRQMAIFIAKALGLQFH